MNMGRGVEDIRIGERLREIAAKNIGIAVSYLGYLLDDPGLPESLAARRPLLDLDPEAPFSKGILSLAGRLAEEGSEARVEEEGLESLVASALEDRH